MNEPSKQSPGGSNGIASDANENPMDQVRDLLFGQVQRGNDEKITELAERLEEMNTEIISRLEALDEKFTRITESLNDDRVQCMQEVGVGFAEIGKQISDRLAKTQLKK